MPAASIDWGSTELLKQFADLGIEVGEKDIRVPKEVAERMRDRARERAREVAYPSVPQAPAHVVRDGMGLAISRGGNRAAHSPEGLRMAREKGMLFRPIHQARHYQIRRLAQPWHGDKTKVGLFVAHKDHWKRGSKPPEGFDDFVRQAEAVLWHPRGGDNPTTLADNLAQLWEDMATINHPVVEPLRSALDGQSIVQWVVHDGAIIWPTGLWAEFWWSRNPGQVSSYSRGRLTTTNRLEVVSHILQRDLVGAEYVCVQEGIPVAVYYKGELIVAPRQNRTDVSFIGYPPSAVEETIDLARAFMDSFDFTAVQLSRGSFAQQIIGLPWDMSPEHFTAFVDSFRESSAGVQRAGQPLFFPMPPGAEQRIQNMPLVPPLNEMGFQAMLSVCISLAAATYRMHPSTINVRPWEGGSGHSLNQGNQTEEIGLAQEEGLQGDMEHLIAAVLNPLVRRCHPDLRVFAWYGDYDAQKEASIIGQRVQTEMTVNEARLQQGSRPLGDWVSDEDWDKASDADKKKHMDNPYNHPMPFAMAKVQQQAQKEMMAQQQAMMGAGGPRGGGGQGDEDGDDPGDEGDDGGWGQDDGAEDGQEDDGQAAQGNPQDEREAVGDYGYDAPMRKAVRRARGRRRQRTITVHLHPRTTDYP